MILVRTRAEINEPLMPIPLLKELGVAMRKDLGAFVQAGTKDVVRVTVQSFGKARD